MRCAQRRKRKSSLGKDGSLIYEGQLQPMPPMCTNYVTSLKKVLFFALPSFRSSLDEQSSLKMKTVRPNRNSSVLKNDFLWFLFRVDLAGSNQDDGNSFKRDRRALKRVEHLALTNFLRETFDPVLDSKAFFDLSGSLNLKLHRRGGEFGNEEGSEKL